MACGYFRPGHVPTITKVPQIRLHLYLGLIRFYWVAPPHQVEIGDKGAFTVDCIIAQEDDGVQGNRS